MESRTNIMENRRRWTRALRSGEYQQITGDLWGTMENGEIGYCCLGVVLVDRGATPSTSFPHNKTGTLISHEMEDGAMVNIEHGGFIEGGYAKKYLGLSGYDVYALSGMNDGLRLDFNQIADLIDAMPITPMHSWKSGKESWVELIGRVVPEKRELAELLLNL